MKRVLLAVAFFSLSVSAQDYLPEGWDEIFMDGKPAYMNINTGEISRSYPKGVARRKVQNNTSSYATTNGSILGGETYTIRSGETLSKVARKYNVNLREIYDLNPSINFDKLAVGQVINVKGNTSGNIHTVKTGETLFRIASNYGMSVSDLKSLNNLSSNSIKIGQNLRVN